jgi:hypothetical protein
MNMDVTTKHTKITKIYLKNSKPSCFAAFRGDTSVGKDCGATKTPIQYDLFPVITAIGYEK